MTLSTSIRFEVFFFEKKVQLFTQNCLTSSVHYRIMYL
nr:MAG TPA: hypothetical protein [Caudoviricetes sp.]